MFVFVMVALVLALIVVPARSQFRSRNWVESQRGRVSLSPNYRAQGDWYVADGSWSLPKKLVDTIGIDCFASAKSVVLDCEEIYDLSSLKGLGRLEELYVNQFVHDFRVLDVLRDLPRLKRVTLSKWSGLSKDQIALLANSLRDVEVIEEE
jgi:hypothetical protein